MRRKTEQELLEEGGTELIGLDLSPERGGRVDAVSVPAARKKGRTLTFLLRKSAGVRHPNNGNAPHLRERGHLEAENPLAGLDPVVRQAFDLLMREIRALSAEVQELKAADRTHANSLLRKDAPKPASRQVIGDDDHVLVHKSALNGGKRTGIFTSVIYPGESR